MADPHLAVDLEIRVPGFRVRPRFDAGAEKVVIFGPSGSGKTLTLRTLAGLLRPHDGTLRLGPRTLDDVRRGVHRPPQERKVGYVPQNYALFPHLTVFENVAYGLRRLPSGDRRRRVEELLGRLRLSDRAGWKPAELSGGQQQRAALARALAPSPEMLLMDEPLGAVDEALRSELREEIRRLQAQDRIPVVLVTHSLTEAYSLADTLVVIVDGEIRQAGPREEVFRHPSTPEVARLVGMENLLTATVTASDGAEVVATLFDTPLRSASGLRPVAGESVVLGIRPEELMVLREPPPEESAENVLQGVVVDDRPEGYDHRLTFRVDGFPEDGPRLAVRIPHPVIRRLALRLGDRRYLAIRPAAIRLFRA